MKKFFERKPVKRTIIGFYIAIIIIVIGSLTTCAPMCFNAVVDSISSK